MADAVMVRMHFNASDFARIMRALNNLENTSEQLEDSLPRKNAIDYANLLRGNINHQKHIAGYPPYHEEYADWKRKYAIFKVEYWKAMGSLINSISFWKEQKGVWRAGIPAGISDAGGTSWFGQGNLGPPKPIAMYARTLEYGEGHNVERPMFRPTLKEYKEGQYIERGEKALKELKSKWT